MQNHFLYICGIYIVSHMCSQVDLFVIYQPSLASLLTVYIHPAICIQVFMFKEVPFTGGWSNSRKSGWTH